MGQLTAIITPPLRSQYFVSALQKILFVLNPKMYYLVIKPIHSIQVNATRTLSLCIIFNIVVSHLPTSLQL
jgi:hypothetical protein